jgi:CRP-like cAMP-binding protein
LACNEDHLTDSAQAEAAVIAASAIGAELNDAEAAMLARVMTVRTLADGEVLVTEGDKNHALFLLAGGRLAVTSPRGEREIKLYVMKSGEIAGTRAFVDRAPRTATLRAAGSAVVYAMEPEAFEALLATHPGVVYKVMRALFRITHSNLMRMNDESRQLNNYIRKTNGRY